MFYGFEQMADKAYQSNQKSEEMTKKKRHSSTEQSENEYLRILLGLTQINFEIVISTL